MSPNSLASIDRFLASRRIAFIGLSRDPGDFSRALFKTFVDRGYDVIPVNPSITEAGGRTCFAHVTDIAPPVEAALVMTPSEQSGQVARECAQAGVRRVWLHRGAGRGAVSAEAVRECRQAGIDVVAGECPFMFLEGSKFPHNVHGWIKKLTSAYPARKL